MDVDDGAPSVDAGAGDSSFFSDADMAAMDAWERDAGLNTSGASDASSAAAAARGGGAAASSTAAAAAAPASPARRIPRSFSLLAPVQPRAAAPTAAVAAAPSPVRQQQQLPGSQGGASSSATSPGGVFSQGAPAAAAGGRGGGRRGGGGNTTVLRIPRPPPPALPPGLTRDSLPPYLRHLDAYQLATALSHPCSRRLVIAAAGSGKTTTARALITHTLSTVCAAHNLPPGCVLALSFSRAAKAAMTEALAKPYAAPPAAAADGGSSAAAPAPASTAPATAIGVEVRTFHSLALSMINLFRREHVRLLAAAAAAERSAWAAAQVAALAATTANATGGGGTGAPRPPTMHPAAIAAAIAAPPPPESLPDPSQPIRLLGDGPGRRLLELALREWDAAHPGDAARWRKEAREFNASLDEDGSYHRPSEYLPITPRQRAAAVFKPAETAKALGWALPGALTGLLVCAGKLPRAPAHLWVLWERQVTAAYVGFTDSARGSNLVTLSDALVHCVALLRDANGSSGSTSGSSSRSSAQPPSPVREWVASRWAFLVCDEAQDTSAMQWALLTELAAATVPPGVTDAAAASMAAAAAAGLPLPPPPALLLPPTDGGAAATAAAAASAAAAVGFMTSQARVRAAKRALAAQGLLGPWLTVVGDEGAWRGGCCGGWAGGRFRPPGLVTHLPCLPA